MSKNVTEIQEARALMAEQIKAMVATFETEHPNVRLDMILLHREGGELHLPLASVAITVRVL